MDKALRYKADAQIGLDHRQNLVGGGGLDIRRKVQAVLREKVGIECIGAGLLPQGNDGMGAERFQGNGCMGQFLKGRAAHGDFLDGHERDAAQFLWNGCWRSDHSQVCHPCLKVSNGGGCSIVNQLEMDAWIAAAEGFERRQEHGTQGYFGCGNAQHPTVQSLTASQFLLCRLQLLHCDGHMTVQRLPFCRQRHLTIGADEQRAPQLPLQVADGTGDVGLAVHQAGCCLGEAL